MSPKTNARNNVGAKPRSKNRKNDGSLILETEIPTLGCVLRIERLFIATVSI
jgi:hypothetical protein